MLCERVLTADEHFTVYSGRDLIDITTFALKDGAEAVQDAKGRSGLSYNVISNPA